MPRLRRVSGQQAIHALERLGFTQVRQRGSHVRRFPMSLVRIGRGGQITLPDKMIDALGLGPGDSLALFQRADEIVLRPIKETLLDLRGSVPAEGPQDFESVREHVKAAVGQKAKEDAADITDSQAALEEAGSVAWDAVKREIDARVHD